MSRSKRCFRRTASAAGFTGLLVVAIAQALSAQELALSMLRTVERDIQIVLPKAMAATVGVGTNGSGVIVTADGYVLTAHHTVPQDEGTVGLQLSDGRKVAAKVLGGDKATDARVLKIVRSGTWPSVPMAEALRPCEVGDWVIGLGHAGGVVVDHEPQVRVGRVQGVSNDGIRTDCAVGPGDSGGPLFDRAGRLIGIHRSADARHSDHTPITIYRSAWDTLIAKPMAEVSRDDAISAFRRAGERIGWSVVRLRSKGKPAALGTVVSDDGLLISKSSELTDPIVMDGPDGQAVAAVVVARSHVHDVVLLKVDASRLGLVAVPWTPPESRRAQPLRPGEFVASVGPAGAPLAVGVVSMAARPVPDLAMLLGMELDESKRGPGVRVIRLTAGGVAEASGMLVDDVFTHINNNAITTRDDLFAEFNRPGQQVVEITMQRGGKPLKAQFPLGNPGRHATDARASRRRNGFPECFRHDAALLPEDCGGPLMTLDGEIVGINIARVGHSASLAIPADTMRQVIRELKAGRSSR